jgi:murein DD-endopeptidase MepM/ murein hydrolase activator NlpD
VSEPETDIDEGILEDELAHGESAAELVAASVTCSAPRPLVFYPVRGKHDNGWQSNPSPDAWGWTCNHENSNSDFHTSPDCIHGKGHYGNDIWAKEGTPVVATVPGTVVEAQYTSYSGNKVTIRDSCGWVSFSIHMKSIAAGITVGRTVVAGETIGYVGHTGTASGGTTHLHFSLYPGLGNYCKGIDPWPSLLKVERDVCWTPVTCGSRVCNKGQFCSASHCCTPNVCSTGCPCGPSSTGAENSLDVDALDTEGGEEAP